MDKLSGFQPESKSASTFSRIRAQLGSPSKVKGNTGLVTLFEAADTLVDLVFVHGLGGGSQKTWSYSASPEHFWPQAWLPRDKDFQNVRIHSFGYDSNWLSTKKDISRISDFASSLLNALYHSPVLQSPADSNIVFVAHSMGGLVVKKAYLLAHEAEAYNSLKERIQSMIFMATPHRGADSATTLNAILKLSLAHSPRGYIEDLTRNSGALEGINDQFRHVADHLDLFSFYETVKTNIGGRNVLIVDRGSAVLDYKHERHMPIQTNHQSICKFSSPEDPNYMLVRNVLASILCDTMSKIRGTKHAMQMEQQNKLKTYLGIIETPIDDLESLQDCRTPRSCEWIIGDPKFLTWRDSHDEEASNYLWLLGKPGAGKSVAASYLISHLRDEKSQDVGYFFFQRGNKHKAWISVCLRSLAYQMALINVQVREALLSLQKDGMHYDMEDERNIWRRIFVGSILRASFQRPFYWVVDALDECSNASTLLDLFGKLNQCHMLRILCASRWSREVSNGFQQLGKFSTVELTVDAVQVDIARYVNANISKALFKDEESQQEITSQILQRASGCFIWVKLVLQKLSKVRTPRTVNDVINGIPQDMDNFYRTILQQISENKEEVEFIKCVLTWAVYSTRPLTVEELREVLKIEMNQDISQLRESVDDLCGQIVYIDATNRLQLVHSTARHFLLSDPDLQLAVSQLDGNNRLLETCLVYLSGKEMDRDKRRRVGKLSFSKSQLQNQQILAAYACVSFSEHLRLASPSHDNFLLLLTKFLRTNVLSWIEYVAKNLMSLHHIMRAARTMKAFLERRSKYVPQLKEEDTVSFIQNCATDLIRVATKFGAFILHAPSAVHVHVPPLCPKESVVYQQFAAKSRGLEVSGISTMAWDDRVSCISFHPTVARAVAYGQHFFAVGINNTIVLHHKSSCVEAKRIDHGEQVRLLEFNYSGELLVSAGVGHVNVHDVIKGELLLGLALGKEPLCIAFANEDRELLVATNQNEICSIELHDGSILDQHKWLDGWSDPDARYEGQVLPMLAVFNSDCTMLAIVYRGKTILLWDVEGRYVVDRLVRYNTDELSNRDISHKNVSVAAHATCEALIFNTTSNLLVAAYQDSELCVFDADIQLLLARVDGHARAFACSPDGQTLVCGEHDGSICVRKFHNLESVYKISTWDDPIQSLAFSTDGLRFIDIRRCFCNVWEPSSLICSAKYEEQSDHSSIEQLGRVRPDKSGPNAAKTVVDSKESESIIHVTAIASIGNGESILIGDEYGAVHICDPRKGFSRQRLYAHSRYTSISIFEWNQENSILLSSDVSNRLIGSKLIREPGGEWTLQKLFDERVDQDGPINQLFLDPTTKHFIVSTSSIDSVWTLEGRLVTKLESWAYSHRWVNHPSPNGGVMALSPTGIRTVALDSPDGISFITHLDTSHVPDSGSTVVQKIVVCPRANYFVMLLELKSGRTRMTKLVAISLSSLVTPGTSDQASSSPNAPTPCMEELEEISKVLRCLIGAFDTKVIFLDQSLFVCTVDLATYKKQRRYTRHFFIPMDWISTAGEPVIQVSRNRDVVFAFKDEIAVVRRGFAMVVEEVVLDVE